MMVLAACSCLGGCASLGDIWHSVFWWRHTEDPLPPRADTGWDALGLVAIGQTGPTPAGEARVAAQWQSALGQPCRRLLLDSGSTLLICQDAQGWYHLRDVGANGADSLR